MKKRMRKVLTAVLAGTMLLGQAVPAGAEEDSGAEAGREKQETVYTAAYYNSVPALPSEIGGEAVTWPELNADEFTALYETAEVKGIYGDGTEITAYVEVVPENLVYFIDSGTGSDWKRTMAGTSDEGAARTLTSLSYLAVKELAGDELLNKVSDQAYDPGEDTWGYGFETGGNRADPIQSYGNNNTALEDNSSVADKYAVGLRASNNTNFEYYLTLEAGTYTMTTGFHEFYNGNHRRNMKPTVMDAADGTVIAEFDEIKMSNNGASSAAPDMVSTGTFTLDKDMMVKVQYVKTGEENGSMNWLAVAAGETPAPVLNRSELRKAVSSAEEIEPDLDQYASISQNTFSRALETAHRALEDDSYTQEQVNAAAELLNAALDAMVVRDENPNRYTTVPVGKTWLDTEGAPIQAHGGGFLQQTDTDGTPVYYWVGEDKSHNTSNFNGVNLYSSKDLVNWTYLNTVLAPDITESGLSDNKIERPKLLYNEKTEKYVLWGHWEDKSGYSSSQICVAVCDTVGGDYEFLGHWRPGADSAHRNWRVTDSGVVYDSGELIEDYSDSSVWGTGSRDFTLYMEDNGEDAYLVSAEDHMTMRIYKLNEEFTDVDPSQTAQLFVDARREAPALTKVGDYYVMITSAQSGWYPNQARYSYTKDLLDADAWSMDEEGRPSGFVGNNTTFYSQPTNVMQVTGESGTTFIYMGDRWNSKELGSSTYVWLPLTIEMTEHGKPEVTMDYVPGWSLDAESGSVILPDTELVSEGKPSWSDAKESADDSFKLYRANDGDYFNENITGGSNAYFKPVTEEGGSTVQVPFSYTIDLEDVYDLSNIDLSFNSHNGSETYYQYTVDTSLNNVNWDTAVDASANTTVGFLSHDLSGIQARYVRVNVNKVVNDHNGNSASWAAGLVEVQVYGKAGDIKPVTELGLTAQPYKIEGRDAVDHVLLKWQNASAATEYRVYRAQSREELEDPEKNAELVYKTDKGTNCEDRIQENVGKTHYYQVIGYLDGNEVSRTAVAEAQTYEKLPSGMEFYSVSAGEGPDLGSGICVDGVYYRYTYRSDDNGFSQYIEETSRDRETWEESGVILDRSDDATLASCKFESMSAEYNEKTGEVVIWGHYELKDGYSTGALFCLHGKPGEPDGFEYSGLVFPNGKEARDKSVFIDDDGTAYLVTASNDPGGSANETMYIHKLSEDWTSVDESEGYVAKVFEGQHREAPAVLKSNGMYYLFTSQAAGWLPSQGAYASAPDLAGPWTELQAPGNTSSFGGQQNGVSKLEGTEAENFFVYASRWWRSEGTAGRVVAPMVMNAGFATTDYFDTVYYNTETGAVVPERSGDVLSWNKEARFNGTDAPETVDGDYNTSTVTDKVWPSEWQVDLGEQYELTGIEISWYLIKGSEAHYPYKVYGSNDGQDWTEILDRSAEGAKESVDYGFTAADLEGSWRYVKVEIIKSRPQNNQNSSWYTPQLWEVKVLGNADGEEESEPVGKKTLEYFLNRAKGYVEDGTVSGLVESVQKMFADAVAEGEAVMADENASRSDVLAAAERLMLAIHALDMKAADKTDLEMALELAAMIDLEKYVEAGQAEYLAAKEAAEAVMTDGDAMQAETDEAWDALAEAISMLRLKADKSTLQDLVDQVSGLDLSGYTEESISVFRAALASANTILADEALSEDDQAQVDEAQEALQTAYDGLVKAGGEDPDNPDTEDPENQGIEDPKNPGTDKQEQSVQDEQAPNQDGSGIGTHAVKTGDIPGSTAVSAVLMMGFAMAGIIAAAVLRQQQKKK